MPASPKAPLPPPVESYPRSIHIDVRRQQAQDIWTAAFLIRILCAFLCLTFFQPDEYFQSLEPAWRLVYGENSGAWITWEWEHQLRSALHPTLIAAVYQLASIFCWILGFPLSIRATTLIVAPRAFHAVCTAVTDYATWRLAARIFGEDSAETASAVILSFMSPWHWFAGARSLTNGLEASLTTIALVHWPWSWITKGSQSKERATERESLRYAVIFAVIACTLRPTNVIIWALLFLALIPNATAFELSYLLQDAAIFTPLVLVVTASIDRWFYGFWTFPAFRFLYFNLAQDLAIFYGSNRFDYYFTEGLPILLTVALPFAWYGIWRVFPEKRPQGDLRDVAVHPTTGGASHMPLSRYASDFALQSLGIVVIGYPIILSFIAHKEVRFLYPIVAPLLVLAARPFAQFFNPLPWPERGSRKALIVLFAVSALTIAVYASMFHQKGPAYVLNYLREQFELHNADKLRFNSKPWRSDFGLMLGEPSLALFLGALINKGFYGQSPATTRPLKPLSAGFLMPCHSTPWRSHMAHPELHAWALTCEPPVNQTPKQRAIYVDEADQFYADPAQWLKGNMGPVPQTAKAWREEGYDQRDLSGPIRNGVSIIRPWPRYLIFFSQLEPTIKEFLGTSSAYVECARIFNTHVHDDWRRQGEFVVYCVGGSLDRFQKRAELNQETEAEWEAAQLRKIEALESQVALADAKREEL